MPHPSRVSSTTAIICVICNKTVSRKADLPRHMRTHDDNKDALMHACPFKGCNYKTLQKSNVQTHIRTHTGERAKKCPEESCSYTTADPGSLTRHRKTIHGYEPKAKPRRVRAHPYARKAARISDDDLVDLTYDSSSSSASSSTSSGSSPSTSTTSLYNGSPSPEPQLGSWADCYLASMAPEVSFPTPEVCTPAMPAPCLPQMSGNEKYNLIEEELFSTPTAEFLKLFSPMLMRSPSPKHLLPAVGAGAVDEANQSFPSLFDFGFLEASYAESQPQHGYDQPIPDYSPLSKAFWTANEDVPAMSPLPSILPSEFDRASSAGTEWDQLFDWEFPATSSPTPSYEQYSFDLETPQPTYDASILQVQCDAPYTAPNLFTDALPSYADLTPSFCDPASLSYAPESWQLGSFSGGCATASP